MSLTEGRICCDLQHYGSSRHVFGHFKIQELLLKCLIRFKIPRMQVQNFLMCFIVPRATFQFLVQV